MKPKGKYRDNIIIYFHWFYCFNLASTNLSSIFKRLSNLFSGFHERRLYEHRAPEQVPPSELRRQLRLLHPDEARVARKSGQEVQVGAGPDLTHEGNYCVKRFQTYY